MLDQNIAIGRALALLEIRYFTKQNHKNANKLCLSLPAQLQGKKICRDTVTLRWPLSAKNLSYH